MASAVVAIFDEYNEAQGAVNELLMNGFEKNQIKLSGEQKELEGRGGGQGKVAGFFKSLFGKEEKSEDIGVYSDAVSHGNYVLTAIAPTEEKTALATEVMSHHHPVNIEGDGQGAGSAQMSGGEELRSSGREMKSTGENQTIPVVEEELKIGKRAVQRGGVRVFQKISEVPIEEEIELREEKVTVERRPVNQPADATTAGAFKEGSFEVRETSEEAVVSKAARVVEEIKIGKEVSQRKETIRDTVRKTEVDVQQLEAEKGYRSHFQQNYASSGASYEDYQPGYQFGSELGRDQRYSDRSFDEIEPDARRQWETRNPGSAWEKFKASIKHAFGR